MTRGWLQVFIGSSSDPLWKEHSTWVGGIIFTPMSDTMPWRVFGLQDADLLVPFNSPLFKQRSNVVQSALNLNFEGISKCTNFSDFPACPLPDQYCTWQLSAEMRERRDVSLFASLRYRPRKLCISCRMLLTKTRLMYSGCRLKCMIRCFLLFPVFVTHSWRQTWHTRRANSGNLKNLYSYLCWCKSGAQTSVPATVVSRVMHHVRCSTREWWNVLRDNYTVSPLRRKRSLWTRGWCSWQHGA